MPNRWWSGLRGPLAPGITPRPSPGSNGGRMAGTDAKQNVDPWPKLPGKAGQWWKPLAFGREIEQFPVAEGVDGPGRKRTSKTERLTDAAFREVNRDEPAIVTRTRRKQGAGAANRQKTAIALSKARANGARIPRS